MFRIKSLQRKDLILNSEGRLDSNRLLRRPRGYLRQAAKPGFSGFRLSQAFRLSERAPRAPAIPAAVEKIKTLLKKIAIWTWI